MRLPIYTIRSSNHNYEKFITYFTNVNINSDYIMNPVLMSIFNRIYNRKSIYQITSINERLKFFGNSIDSAYYFNTRRRFVENLHRIYGLDNFIRLKNVSVYNLTDSIKLRRLYIYENK